MKTQRSLNFISFNRKKEEKKLHKSVQKKAQLDLVSKY